ncbi:MAG: glycine cleavage system protein GcvH [Ardenticatenaceae bacterium]|nr:glycine cleavage system protein GcvH [Anaerolineales bacterium]MCB8977343.1 glycine cleavage system protein GcvH [Ardenticatenaceae bacterium]MCB9446699.1 glycine cleavage system protein GcvH [Ardenticatenaceae bacterium]
MSKIPANLRYTNDDEWVSIDGDTATIGITDHAQDALSDIVYLELPSVGDFFGVGETFGVVESVKAAADLLMAVSGDVTAVNEDLIDTPEQLNADPYGSWLIKVKMSAPAEFNDLMDADGYQEHLSALE